MTDCFALLDQPRAPWLDPTSLKEVFHRKTLEQHPDTSASSSSNAFAELNEAYQVLQDPKRRLQHLLELQGRAPAAEQTIPAEFQELFLQIGALSQRVNLLLEESRTATTALSRAILKPKVIEAQRDVESGRVTVREGIETANRELHETSATQHDALSALHLRFAYLGRWSAQLDELAFQLSNL